VKIAIICNAIHMLHLLKKLLLGKLNPHGFSFKFCIFIFTNKQFILFITSPFFQNLESLFDVFVKKD